ncbi:hypothetical protein LC2W_2876 [Lacticaseibacillus paracasei]|nr:hypothetical protein LC2W_2876 [Lacticaseibacillus paracasei]AEA58396.1 hypothetical protein LCBD_2902 [Lacticaseibacillus paracasei]EPC34799.1 hypothetical protein Lpp223_0980 [Lacticaseibacillus paracasei subsp. paracasei Lpp223]KTE99799.1 hypothetical protein AC564_0470 [Lacticaseibacillus paracasei]OUC66038.1 hypothetical protein BLL69_2581c [Lacticaseibacillus paracasei]
MLSSTSFVLAAKDKPKQPPNKKRVPNQRNTFLVVLKGFSR